MLVCSGVLQVVVIAVSSVSSGIISRAFKYSVICSLTVFSRVLTGGDGFMPLVSPMVVVLFLVLYCSPPCHIVSSLGLLKLKCVWGTAVWSSL